MLTPFQTLCILRGIAGDYFMAGGYTYGWSKCGDHVEAQIGDESWTCHDYAPLIGEASEWEACQ